MKIVKADIAGILAWDNNDRYNDNNTYCKLATEKVGCNVWHAVPGIYSDGKHSGTVGSDSSLNRYLNVDYYNSLNGDKKHIAKHKFYIGKIGLGSVEQIYAEEKQEIWSGLIGLLNVSDFFKASTNSACDSYAVSRSLDAPCIFEKGNYLDELKKETWTINSYKAESGNGKLSEIASTHTISAYFSDVKGGVSGWYSITNYYVRPVLYLNANIKLDGLGTKDKPYTIK